MRRSPTSAPGGGAHTQHAPFQPAVAGEAIGCALAEEAHMPSPWLPIGCGVDLCLLQRGPELPDHASIPRGGTASVTSPSTRPLMSTDGTSKRSSSLRCH